MKRIYLLEVFFSFDGIEYTYKHSRTYTSAKAMNDCISHWEKAYQYTVFSKTDGETVYTTNIRGFYKLRISQPFVNYNVF